MIILCYYYLLNDNQLHPGQTLREWINISQSLIIDDINTSNNS